MKIDFSSIKFRPSLFEEEKTISDFHRQLANAIWQQKDVAAGRLALRLFDNPEIEIDETEKGFITEALESFVQWVKSPVLEKLNA